MPGMPTYCASSSMASPAASGSIWADLAFSASITW